GAEAVAVCFLHSYRFPDHERRAGALLRKLLPGCFVTLSVDVLPQIREYERTSTTVVNAYVGPPVKRYLEGMEADLAAAGCNARISVMQSSGGSIS
ncbi:hydantoinase/oxoprolinase family protein, partial [bacterium M00.F.Ca.ET.168.01.1.1]